MSLATAEILQQVKVPVPMGAVEAFCRTWQVIEFALFGSVLRDDFGPNSDVDVLVTFDPEARPTLLTLIRMQNELEAMLGRRVDLLERGGMEQSARPHVRQAVLDSIRVLYAQ
jgi:uncharacterized protein